MNTDGPVTDSEGLDGVRLLSFDGGDIRTVSQLIILDEFMRRIEEERKSTTRILPCDYFHMIGGVGASGIIVILLTILRMGIEETIEEFIEIWNQVFADAALDQAARSAKLKAVINDLLIRRGLGESQRMDNGDQGGSSCKAFVCAIPESNLGICEKFRTYKSQETSLNPTIVEAIRATCAVPTLFLPVSVESVGCQVSYISGAYNLNNPAAESIKEACQCFGRDQRVACMLSLGCGQRAITHLTQANEMKVMSLVNDFACDCERVDRDLGWRIGDSNVYYRLSVNQILDASGTDVINPIGNITSCTKGFLDHHETGSKMNKCVHASESIGGVTLRDISGLNEPRSTSVHGLPSLSEFFVERPALMKTMAQCLFQLGPLIQRGMVLSGLGGIGKTQITVRFLLRYQARFRHILFIDGSSEQSIESGLVTRVNSLGATYDRSSAHEALEVLSNPDYEITRHWAIIYDNVDNPEIDIGRYFPNCAFGTIIITTRNPNVGILASKAHLKLDVMSKEEAAEVLLRSAIDSSREPTDGEKEEAHEIAKDLGYLPVALVQAGYFIRIHDCLGKYRERLRKHRPDILGRPAKYQLDTHDGLYACLDVTWPYLTTGAQHFMSILGFVNYTGFPIILLYRAAARGFLFEPFQLADRPLSFQDTIRLLCATFRPQEEPSEQDLDDMVAELERYSLVTRMITFKVTTLRLHPLVHSWTYDRLSPREKEMYLAAAVRILVCGTGNDDEDIYEFIYPHICVMSDQLKNMHANDRAGLATILAHQGALTIAIKIWKEIQSTLRPVYQRDDLRSGETDLQLARLYRRSACFTAALALENEVVQIRERTLGPEHPKTVQAVLQLATGVAYTSTKDAEKLLRGALNILEKQSGDHWETVLQTKEALAFWCEDGSISLYTEILNARMERDGPDHHATLRVMESLAKKYRKYRTFDRENTATNSRSATDLWLSIVSTRATRRGREHPDTLDAIENLARSYALQNMYDESLEQWKEVARLRKAVQGADHESTLKAITGLARIYRKTGKYPEAVGQWKEVVRMTKQIDGPSQVETIHAVRELASTFEEAKQYPEAAVQWKEIVHLMSKIQGPSHETTLGSMASLVHAYEAAKQYTEAEVQQREIVYLLKEARGPSHKNTLNAMSSLAKICEKADQCSKAELQWKEIVQLANFYERIRQYNEAEVQRKEIVQVRKEAHGLSHKDTLFAMTKLARFYARIQQVMTEAHGPGHADALQAMGSLAKAYQRSEQHIEAEAEWKGILQVTKEIYGPSHADTLRAMRKLVKFYERRRQYTEAGLQWKEIVQMMKDARGQTHTSTLREMRVLVQFHEGKQQYTEAQAQWKEIVQVTKEAHGLSHWDTLNAMTELAKFYARIQHYTKAEVQWKEIVRLAKETPRSGHYDASWTMREMASMYKTCGRYEDAEAVLINAKNYVPKAAGNASYICAHIDQLIKEVHVEQRRCRGDRGNLRRPGA